jgi:hypothetical protein
MLSIFFWWGAMTILNTHATAISTSISLDDILSWSGQDAAHSSFVLLYDGSLNSSLLCKELYRAQFLHSSLHFASPSIKVGTFALERQLEAALPKKLRVSFKSLPAWISMVRHGRSEYPFISQYEYGTTLHDVVSFWMRIHKDLQPRTQHAMHLAASSLNALSSSKSQTTLVGIVNASSCSSLVIARSVLSLSLAFAGEPHTVVGLLDVSNDQTLPSALLGNAQVPAVWLAGRGALPNPRQIETSDPRELIKVLNQV